jgi:hypothetical protein
VSDPCSVDGCPKYAAKGGLCWGHAKRKQRGLVVDAELRRRYGTKTEMLVEAALVLIEVAPTDKAGWTRAVEQLRLAAKRYVGMPPTNGVPQATKNDS